MISTRLSGYSQNIRIWHNDITISLVCHTPSAIIDGQHFMEEMRLFRGKMDITYLHPDVVDGTDVYISSFEDVLETIKLIDGGCFDEVILLTDEVQI